MSKIIFLSKCVSVPKLLHHIRVLPAQICNDQVRRFYCVRDYRDRAFADPKAHFGPGRRLDSHRFESRANRRYHPVLFRSIRRKDKSSGLMPSLFQDECLLWFVHGYLKQ